MFCIDCVESCVKVTLVASVKINMSTSAEGDVGKKKTLLFILDK